MYAIGLRPELQDIVTAHFSIRLEMDLSALPERLNNERLLIDSASIDQVAVYEFRSDYPDVQIIYIVDAIKPTLSSFASAQSLYLVVPSKLLSYLEEEQTEQEQNPVLAFWGVLPQLGTTTIALSVAQAIAQKQSLSVGLIGLNAYNPGAWMLSNTSRHLDDLQSFMRLRKLDKETLLSSMESVYGIQYLLGERNPTRAWEYKPEDVSYLIHVAKSSFDVVVLDVGSVLNTALALEGLSKSTHRYVVANDLLATRDAFFNYLDYVLKPLGIAESDLMLVGSKLHNRGVNGFARSFQVSPITGIPNLESIAYFSEQQVDRMKMFLDEKPFRRSIESIVSSVTKHKPSIVIAR